MLLTGKHHGESADADKLGYEIISYMRKLTDEMKDRNHLNFTFYATPAEGVSGRFPMLDKKLFGTIPGVTDKGFYTNSYHVPVEYNIGVKEKIDIEAKYHKLCNAGNISYIELKEAPINNPTGLMTIMRYFHNSGANYWGVNYPIDECMDCGHGGIMDDECPNCHSHSINKIRRVTGYLSYSHRFTPGKVAELNSRVIHGEV